jgi:uncharacterized membrane protein YeaQ/YmgE (transglycosylase-associated protein family)
VSVWWGAISWCAAGLLLAVLLRLLPPWRGTSWLAALAVGLAGATSGGVLATVLEFGGVAAFDWRSLVAAALAALLAMLLLALLRTRSVSGSGEADRRGARRPAG